MGIGGIRNDARVKKKHWIDALIQSVHVKLEELDISSEWISFSFLGKSLANIKNFAVFFH